MPELAGPGTGSRAAGWQQDQRRSERLRRPRRRIHRPGPQRRGAGAAAPGHRVRVRGGGRRGGDRGRREAPGQPPGVGCPGMSEPEGIQLESVLVANRGEIARRIIRTVRRMGIRAIAVYSEADAGLPYGAEADEAVPIGPAPAASSYLDVGGVLGAARRTGAAAIHPGYGFLAESAEFAARVIDAGMTWVGPPPSAIGQMGDKINARNLMEQAGVPVAAGSKEPGAAVGAAVAEAGRIGYPVVSKAAAGGGGIGMSAAADEAELRAGFQTPRPPARPVFRSSAIL